MSLRVAFALLALVLALPVATARADPPWGSPLVLDTPALEDSGPGVLVDPTGRTLVAWTAGSETRLASVAPDGATASPPPLGGLLQSLAPTGDRSALLLLTVLGRRETLRAVDVTSAGRATRTTTIADGVMISRLRALAANPRGAAIVAWGRVAGRSGGPRIRARLRPAAQRPFGAVVTLARVLDVSDIGGLGVAVGPRGETAVLWANARVRPPRLLVRIKRPGDRGFGPALVVGRGDGRTAIAATYTTSGRLVVVWGTQDGGEQADRPWVVHFATLAPRARAFGRERVLDRGDLAEVPWGRLAVVATPDGGAVAGWTSVERPPDRSPVRVATIGRDGTVGAAQTLDRVGALDDLAVASDSGAVLATWTRAHDATRLLGDDTRVYAALKRPGGAFGAPEAVSAPARTGAAAALDPSARRPTVAWATVHPAYLLQPSSSADTAVELSVRGG